MTDKSDPVADALSKLKAPWTLRLGWKLNKGGIMTWMLSFLDKYLGKNWKRIAFGVAFCLALVLNGLVHLFPGLPIVSQALTILMTVTQFLGLGSDAPVTIGQGVAIAISSLTALVAVIQPLMRWVVGVDDAPKQ